MTKKLGLLYRFLMERFATGVPFTMDQAIEATGYEESSLRTNISKHLKGKWIEILDGGQYRVCDFGSVTPAVFASAMSQITRLTFADQSEWRAQLERLLALGRQQGYPVSTVVAEVMASLGEERE